VFLLEDIGHEGAGHNHLLCSLLLAMTAEHAVTILMEPSLIHGVQILPGLLAETIVKLFFGQLSHRNGDLFLIL